MSLNRCTSRLPPLSVCGCPKSENNWRPLPQAQPAFHNTGSFFHTSCIAVFCHVYFTRQKCFPTSPTIYCMTWNIMYELIKYAIWVEVSPLKTCETSHRSRFPDVWCSQWRHWSTLLGPLCIIQPRDIARARCLQPFLCTESSRPGKQDLLGKSLTQRGKGSCVGFYMNCDLSASSWFSPIDLWSTLECLRQSNEGSILPILLLNKYFSPNSEREKAVLPDKYTKQCKRLTRAYLLLLLKYVAGQ